jgi:alkylation response protein AidB-like acyl-CoA dehydrogenase
MDFELTEEQRAFRDVAAGFAAEHMAPFADEWDEKSIFPVETLRKAAPSSASAASTCATTSAGQGSPGSTRR